MSTPGPCGGRPRTDGHRITVEDVATWHERMDMSPDELSRNTRASPFPTFTPPLAYDFENREAIDADIREGKEFVEKLRAGGPSLVQKVRQRTADASGHQPETAEES